MGGFALAAAQIGQFMKLDEMSVTSISHDGLSSAGSAPCLGAIVRVVADNDGIVPGCPGGGVVVWVVADDDGVVPGCPVGEAPQSLVWCSMLQMTTPSRIPRSGRTSPMESVARRL